MFKNLLKNNHATIINKIIMQVSSECRPMVQFWGPKIVSKFNILGNVQNSSQELHYCNFWVQKYYASILRECRFFIVKTMNDPWTYTGSQEGFNVLHRIIKVWKSFSWELQCYNFNITLQASTESEDFKLYKPWAHDPDTGPQRGVNDQYRNACK